MTVKQIWRLLIGRGIEASYPSVKRFVRSRVEPAVPRVTVRLECPPRRQGKWISERRG